jgi:PAS domain S-box-containing protein
MNMSQQIEAVHRRASLLRQQAMASPVQQNLLEAALRELSLVLEELQVSEEELQRQNQDLITTRQHVEVERQRYQTLFDLAPDGYLVTNQTGIIQKANVAIASMLYVAQEYLIGKPFSLFIAEADRSILYTTLEQSKPQHFINQPQIKDWEIQIFPYQGTSLSVAITLSITNDGEDSEVNFLWLLRDVTQKKQMTRLLEQLNTKLEQQVIERTAQLQQALNFEISLKRITDKVRDSLDENQILQVVVQELTQVLEILGCETTFYHLDSGAMTTRDRSHSSDDAAIATLLTHAQQDTSLTVFPEGYRQLLQGQYLQFCEMTPTLVAVQVSILICPIADDQTVVGGLHLFKSPLEAFSDAEIRLVQQVANQCAIAVRQARLYQSSQQQVHELKRLHQLKDDFLGTVSHEFRTPLSNMNMAIQMLDLIVQQPDRFTDKQPRLSRYLEILRKQCSQEISLVNNLLDLSRLNANAEPLVPIPIDLYAWIPHLISPFAERIQQQQQHLQVNISPDLPILITDESLLTRILTELLHNACKYTPHDQAIVITADTTDQTLQLSISNSGIDLPPQEIANLFEAFYRVPTHDPWKHGGTGLGLALVKKQVEYIGGVIAVVNQEGWITFTLQLPLQLD